MKKIAISLLASLCLVAVSCSLDTYPTDKYVLETFWDTEDGAEAAMTGCYNILVSTGLFGGSTPLLEETCTPNAYNYNDQLGFNKIALGTHSAGETDGIIVSRWAKCYEGIGRCNTHLDRLPGSGASAARKATMEGEAKFLRALYYYMLISYYNDVPLILETPKFEHGSLPRTPRAKVVEAIVKDLDDAAELLDWKWASKNDLGRATKASALALKARVLLFEASPLVNTAEDPAKWQAAADAAKALMDQEAAAGVGLYPDYRKMFLPANEHNCEVLFDVEFTKTSGASVNTFNTYCIQYRNNAPLLDLVNEYETSTGGKATPGVYTGRDPRFAATIFYPGSTFLGTANATAVTICQFTGFAHKKLSIYDSQARDSDDGRGEQNYIVLRYADILLMFAEAQNEALSSPSNEVYDALNRVRSRAMMPTYAYGSMSKAEMRKAIRHERRIEFAGEGLYYNDIRRWMTAENVMNAVIKAHDGTSIVARNFNEKRDYWWPIPYEQIQLNPSLKQNPKY